jgi:hypothetical protein
LSFLLAKPETRLSISDLSSLPVVISFTKPIFKRDKPSISFVKRTQVLLEERIFLCTKAQLRTEDFLHFWEEFRILRH